METLDGIDVYLNDTGVTSYVIDFYLYASIPGGLPTTLIASQTGFGGLPGWNRLLLAAPKTISPGADRVVVLKIVGTGGNVSARYDITGLSSGRCYIDNDGAGAFFALTSDLNQKLLLSQGPPGVPSGLSGTAMKGAKTDLPGNSITVTWDASSCPAPEYILLYGGGSQLPASYSGAYGLAVAQCTGLGTGGSSGYCSSTTKSTTNSCGG